MKIRLSNTLLGSATRVTPGRYVVATTMYPWMGDTDTNSGAGTPA